MNKIKKLINKIFKVFENDCDDSEETYASVNQTYVNIDQKMNDFNKLIVNISQENAKQKK